MKSCEQTSGQSVYAHGLDVWNHYKWILDSLRDERHEEHIPEWMYEYRDVLLENQLPIDIVKEYLIMHDCGKPFCLEIDEEGRKHFPNHSQVSYETYKKVSDNEQVANLILHDMDIHKLKSEDIEEFAQRPEAATHLLAGLAEINSNATMFGGFDSTSYKIKYKQINKKGKKLCSILESNKNNVSN